MLCNAFMDEHARLLALQDDLLRHYRALRARVREQLGPRGAARLSAVRAHLRGAAPAPLLVNDKLGAEPGALCPDLVQRLQRFQWNRVLVQDQHGRIRDVPEASAHAAIKQALHVGSLKITAQAVEQHRRMRRTERLPDGTVRSQEEEVRTRALRVEGRACGARHALAQQVLPQVRALEGSCALQELRVEGVEHVAESARRLCRRLEEELEKVRHAME